MSRELLLLRHGKSDWSVEVDDFHRPLKKRGDKAVAKVGIWLQQHDWLPDWIVSSPAVRARKTAEKVCRILKFDDARLKFDERIYQADVDGLIRVLADCPADAGRVLLVGHNPELEELLRHLVGTVQTPADGKLLATATLARMRVPVDWSDLTPRCAQLLSITRPQSMGA